MYEGVEGVYEGVEKVYEGVYEEWTGKVYKRVNHLSHVRLIDTHTKRRGSNHTSRNPSIKHLLRLFSLMQVHSCMIDYRRHSRRLQVIAETVGLVSPPYIHYGQRECLGSLATLMKLPLSLDCFPLLSLYHPCICIPYICDITPCPFHILADVLY